MHTSAVKTLFPLRFENFSKFFLRIKDRYFQSSPIVVNFMQNAVCIKLLSDQWFLKCYVLFQVTAMQRLKLTVQEIRFLDKCPQHQFCKWVPSTFLQDLYRILHLQIHILAVMEQIVLKWIVKKDLYGIREGTGNTDKMESSNHQLPPIFPPYIIFLVSVTIVLPKRVVSRLKTMKQFGPSFVILNTGRMSSWWRDPH